MLRLIISVSLAVGISGSAYAGSITNWVCEYTYLTNKTAIKLTADANLTSSATFTYDGSSPTGTYTISTNTITSTVSNEQNCGTMDFVITDGSTTYND